MSTEDKTKFLEMLGELNGGVYLEQIVTAFKTVALGTVVHGDKGKAGSVTLSFNFKRIGETTQLSMVHALAFSQPTNRGKKSEEGKTETPLYVGSAGVLTLLPNSTRPLFAEADSGEG